MTYDWIKLSTKAMEISSLQSKVLHVNKIAELIQQHDLVKNMSTEQIKSSVNSALARNIKSKNRIFSKSNVKGKKKGFYFLKRKVIQKQDYVDPLYGDKFAKHFTGKAGEHAVLSELLFRGFNAGHFSVDVGMDLIATKNNISFFIQVKTAKINANNSFSSLIREDSFEHGRHIFYIIVLRENKVNNYFIVSSDALRNLKRKKVLSESKNINIKIDKKSSGYWIGSEKVNNHINDFDSIS